MLEAGNTLRTWAIPSLPYGWEAAQARTTAAFLSCAATSKEMSVVATRLADHRIDYLHEEGPLTGDRGEVRRIDAGTYETVAEDSQSWRAVLSGEVIQGEITLQESMISL
jgi:hypothetical protein